MKNIQVKTLSGTIGVTVLGVAIYISACFMADEDEDCGCDVKAEFVDAGVNDSGEEEICDAGCEEDAGE